MCGLALTQVHADSTMQEGKQNREVFCGLTLTQVHTGSTLQERKVDRIVLTV